MSTCKVLEAIVPRASDIRDVHTSYLLPPPCLPHLLMTGKSPLLLFSVASCMAQILLSSSGIPPHDLLLSSSGIPARTAMIPRDACCVLTWHDLPRCHCPLCFARERKSIKLNIVYIARGTRSSRLFSTSHGVIMEPELPGSREKKKKTRKLREDKDRPRARLYNQKKIQRRSRPDFQRPKRVLISASSFLSLSPKGNL